jgi:hypothetical protein
MAMRKRNFAVFFIPWSGTKVVDTSTKPKAMDLNFILAKLLEDRYSSAQAFRDDIQVIAENVRELWRSGGPGIRHGDEMLEHVDKLLAKLPKAPSPRTSKAIVRKWSQVNTGGKRKTDEGFPLESLERTVLPGG